MSKRVTITLPLPPRVLSPNARCHWAQKSKAVKAYRQAACLAGMQYAAPAWARAMTRVTWYTKTKRHPDADNALSSLKACWDGLKDARIITDDNELGHHPIRFEVDKKNPRVEIAIEEAA